MRACVHKQIWQRVTQVCASEDGRARVSALPEASTGAVNTGDFQPYPQDLPPDRDMAAIRMGNPAPDHTLVCTHATYRDASTHTQIVQLLMIAEDPFNERAAYMEVFDVIFCVRSPHLKMKERKPTQLKACDEQSLGQKCCAPVNQPCRRKR